MKPSERESEKPSFWQLVFAQSKVNGALYLGEQLPGRSWDWPKNTYFQRRLRASEVVPNIGKDSAKLVC
jgi:hypothetical protein